MAALHDDEYDRLDWLFDNIGEQAHLAAQTRPIGAFAEFRTTAESFARERPERLHALIMEIESLLRRLLNLRKARLEGRIRPDDLKHQFKATLVRLDSVRSRQLKADALILART